MVKHRGITIKQWELDYSKMMENGGLSIKKWDSPLNIMV